MTDSYSSITASLEQLLQQCAQQQQTMRALVAMAPTLNESNPDLQSFASSIHALESSLSATVEAMDEEDAALATLQNDILPAMKERREQLLKQKVEVQKTLANAVPLQGQPLAEVTNQEPRETQQSGKSAPAATAKKRRQSRHSSSVAPVATPASPSTNNTPPPPIEEVSPIQMPHVNEEEFATIPKYMRGRLDRSKLNSAIDTWLELLHAKYPDATSSSSSSSTASSTLGPFILTSDELRAAPVFQSLGSTNLKAVLVGLRHVGRIKNSNEVGSPSYILC